MLSFNNIGDWVKGLSFSRKLMFLGGVTLAIAALIIAITLIQTPTYHILFSNLSDEDAGIIVQKIKEQKIPYKVEGNAIKVPVERVHDLRLQLASQGLPQGGGVGFELFDKTDISTTDFVQKLNYRRALQGELSRTIRALPEIEQCRVHLAVPEKTVFVRAAEKPKASVFVKLKPGKRLSKGQVDGIVHLVASSIEGLEPNAVTVVDSKGELLTSVNDETAGMTNAQMERQQILEKDLESRILSMLEPVIGKNKVRAKVAVSLNLTKTEKTEERYDPDGQVPRSEQKTSEKSTTGSTGGAPGVASNLPGKTPPPAAALKGQTDKKSEIINYEVSKTVSHHIIVPGEIKRLSAAVLVDGSYAAAEGSKEQKYTARTEEELKQYEEMVKRAIGFMAERGDDIKVVNMPFESVPAEEIQPSKKEIIPVVMEVAKYLLPLVALILLFLFVIRPLMKVATTPRPSDKQVLPASSPAEIERERLKELTGKTPKEMISEWARDNTKEAANLIKAWINER